MYENKLLTKIDLVVRFIHFIVMVLSVFLFINLKQLSSGAIKMIPRLLECTAEFWNINWTPIHKLLSPEKFWNLFRSECSWWLFAQVQEKSLKVGFDRTDHRELTMPGSDFCQYSYLSLDISWWFRCIETASTSIWALWEWRYLCRISIVF